MHTPESPRAPECLLIAGPGDKLVTGRFAGLLLAGHQQPTPVPAAAATTLVVADFDDWPRSCGTAPELPYLSWTLAEGGQPIEVLLAGLEAGKSLVASGFNMLLGPSLLPSRWRGDPALTARTSTALIEGLTAAGLIVCADGFPTAHDELAGDAAASLDPYGAAFAHGVEAVRLGRSRGEGGEDLARHAATACRQLRQELGFTGVIVGDTGAADAAALLAAGCDLLVTGDPEGAAARLRAAVESGEITDRQVAVATGRTRQLINAWL